MRKMTNLVDMTGHRCGHLVVRRRCLNRAHNHGRNAYWVCGCRFPGCRTRAKCVRGSLLRWVRARRKATGYDRVVACGGHGRRFGAIQQEVRYYGKG